MYAAFYRNCSQVFLFFFAEQFLQNTLFDLLFVRHTCGLVQKVLHAPNTEQKMNNFLKVRHFLDLFMYQNEFHLFFSFRKFRQCVALIRFRFCV